MPYAEIKLWQHLRSRQLQGVKFRRQHSIGSYVVDFYATKPRLAIEIDGDSHFVGDRPTYDKQRQQYIEACGIKFLRFTNQEIASNLPGVVKIIKQAILRPSPHVRGRKGWGVTDKISTPSNSPSLEGEE